MHTFLSLHKDFQDGYSDLKHGAFAFKDFTTVCKDRQEHFGDQVTVTQEFAETVCTLPETYNAEAYHEFVDYWGTVITVCNYIRI